MIYSHITIIIPTIVLWFYYYYFFFFQHARDVYCRYYDWLSPSDVDSGRPMFWRQNGLFVRMHQNIIKRESHTHLFLSFENIVIIPIGIFIFFFFRFKQSIIIHYNSKDVHKRKTRYHVSSSIIVRVVRKPNLTYTKILQFITFYQRLATLTSLNIVFL